MLIEARIGLESLLDKVEYEMMELLIAPSQGCLVSDSSAVADGRSGSSALPSGIIFYNDADQLFTNTH